MKKDIALIAFMGILAIGLFAYSRTLPEIPYLPPFNQTAKTEVTQPPDGDDQSVVLGVFEGISPCADCERIKMKLTLYTDPATQGAAGYSLEQVYVGKGDQKFTEEGSWDYLRGTPTDENATVYILNPDRPKENQMYFLKISDNEIKMLGVDLQEYQLPEGFTNILKRQQE